MHCTWQLTPRCESFCHLCEHRAESAQEELDAAACARVADELGRHGALLVSFTGSEPFLHGELAAVVAAVARRHFPLLVTNGWLVNAANARAVWQAGLEAASVTFEHADRERHDAATGLAGSHARALAALATLARERTRRGQRVNVRTRLRDGDVEALPDLLALAERHGATVTVEAAFPLPELDGNGDALARGAAATEETPSEPAQLRAGARQARRRRCAEASRAVSPDAPSSMSTIAAWSRAASSSVRRPIGRGRWPRSAGRTCARACERSRPGTPAAPASTLRAPRSRRCTRYAGSSVGCAPW